jgi:hydroxyacylglutathione hydrolase
MLFRRLYHDRLAQASYLLACQGTMEAIVVDPLRDPEPYLRAARALGVRIAYVVETHVHADFLSGARALADAASAELLLSGEGTSAASYRRAAFPAARWLRAGDTIDVGAVRLDVLHVAGHTPEHLAFLVTDTATSAEPAGLLSGDFLFVGDVGRPDLLERAVGVEGSMQGAARDLYASLQRVRALPEFIQLWPGHGAGSACGKALGAMPQSTLGYELRANWAFGAREPNEFAALVLAGQPTPPAYFARMKQLNATGVPALAPPATPPPDACALREAVRRGALLVDVRQPAEFAAGHVRHALNMPLGKSFLGWMASLLPAERDLVLLAAPDERADAAQAARDLRLVGMDRVLGVLLSTDMTTELSETLHIVDGQALGTQALAGATVVDVRNDDEWHEGRVPGARHIPLGELAARAEELRGAGPLLVHCQGGTRSAIAVSMLLAHGFRDVSNVAGGYAAWKAAGHTPERDG